MVNFNEGSKASEVPQHPQKSINIAAGKGDTQTVQRLLIDGDNANHKDIYGRTPLHYAVNKGHIDIVNILLKNGANVCEVTKKGNTPLHTATFKCYKEIVDVLLQHISRDKLNAFVDGKTTSSGTTALHVAAKSGSLEVVKCLLEHGATYEIENKEGKIPIDLAKDPKVTNLLKLIEELFGDIKNGDVESISKLGAVKPDESLAITSARNNQGNTLLQVAIMQVNKHKNIASELLKMLKEPDQVQLPFRREPEFNQLKSLKSAAEVHISFSELYLPMLRSMSQPSGSEKNPFPWKALKEGSYYLGTAYRFIEVYKEYKNGSIDNENIQSVNDMLVALEFDPKHITSGYTAEAYGGAAEWFVSKAQDTKYYKLLHSDLKKEIRSFIEMVESNIDIPVKKFLESVKKRFELYYLEELKSVAEVHIKFSEIYLPVLRNMSHPYRSEKNMCPWSSLKEGSYYLGNAHALVEVYKDYVSGSIDNENIQSVNDILVALEFDPKHITSGYSDEAYGGTTKCFVSKGQDTKYYNLLHSELKIDLRSFIEIVEFNIEIPVKKFLQSIKQRFQLIHLKKLKSVAEVHIKFSNMYLPMLRNMSHPYGSERNMCPWSSLKEGSYYLGNAYTLVEVYKNCIPGSIDNNNIQAVNDILVALEFDPKHITSGYTDEAYGGTTECFVSKGQGTKYYNLLHSELKRDVRSFIEIVERNIDIPVKMFLESLR